MVLIYPVCMHLPVVFCLEHDFWILRFTGCGLFGWCVFVMCIHIWFCRVRKRAGAEGQPKRLFSGLFPVFSWFFRVNSLIINTIHFCWFVCNCRLVGYIFGELGLWWLQRLTLLIRRSETGCRACRRYNLRQTRFSGCGLLYCPEIS